MLADSALSTANWSVNDPFKDSEATISQPGTVEGQVGGMRVVSMGLNSYVEQLECLDEEARQL